MNKYDIISNYDKNVFLDFIEDDSNGRILELLDEIGLKILSKSEHINEIIKIIITKSPYNNELLHNQSFIDLLLSNNKIWSELDLVILNFDTYDYIMNRAINMKTLSYNEIMQLFNHFSLDYKVKKINDWPYPSKWLYSIMNNESTIVKSIIKKIDQMIYQNNIRYKLDLNELDFETYDNILNKIVEMNILNPSSTMRLFNSFSLDYRIKKVSNWPYPTEWLYYLLYSDIAVVSSILKHHNIDFNKVDIAHFFNRAKETLLSNHINVEAKRNDDTTISSNIITKDLLKKIWDTYDIFEIRRIINDANYVLDTSEINTYVRKQENRIISETYEALMSPYKEVYDIIIQKENDDSSSTQDNADIDAFYDTLYALIGNTKYSDEFEKITNMLSNGEPKKALDYIIKTNNRMLSNYIIDYHFEENYHNIVIDINELLRFYNEGNIDLPLEKVELYKKIMNIDSLTAKEKKIFHEQLKQYNLIEQFYDDMSFARKIVSEAIKNYSLSKESIKQFRDEELSNKYGVDVYVMGNNSFFALVKSSENNHDEYPTGHSYSLIGRDCLAVFGDPNKADTFIYDSKTMNPEQLVHVFPYDSMTFYQPFKGVVEATSYVYTLMLPKALVEFNNTYPELLMLEKGNISTDLDERIPKLKKLALYCVDEIKNKHVEVAKNEGVGIILVDSKYEKLFSNNEDSNIDLEYQYFYGNKFEKDTYESKRL